MHTNEKTEGGLQMRKIIKKIVKYAMKYVSVAAFLLAVSSVNSACFFWSYQPKLPAELKKYEK